jgi:hypothetical protein
VQWLAAMGASSLVTLALLCDRLGVDPILFGQPVQARLTMLYRSTHCRCRAGAAMKNLSHCGSQEGKCSYFTPSHCRTTP